MFNPQPKEEKKEKSRTAIKKVSNVNKYRCSDGHIVSQRFINSRLSSMRIRMIMENELMCQAYPSEKANDFDHTISQKRCKQLGKTELIWSPENISISSRLAHAEWECYASGAFEEHTNVVERMLFVKARDTEMFEKRFQRLSNYKVMKALKQ
jgi:hypothetical protein